MGLPGPDLSVRVTDPAPDQILPLLSKNARKIFLSTVLCLLNDFLSSKNDMNVPSKSNKQNI